MHDAALSVVTAPRYDVSVVPGDAPGLWVADGFLPGATACLRVDAPGYAGKRIGPFALMPGVRQMGVVLTPGRRVEVSALDEADRPAPGATLSVRSMDIPLPTEDEPPRLVIALAETARVLANQPLVGGTTVLEDLPQGPLEFTARHPDLGWASARTGPGDERVVLRFGARAEVVLRGTVASRGCTPGGPEGFVAAYAPAAHIESFEASVVDGAFALRLPRAGRWWVLAAAMGCAPRVAELEIGPGATEWSPELRPECDVELRAMDLDGAPVSSAFAYVYDRHGQPVFGRLPEDLMLNRVRFDDEGRARLLGVPCEELALVVHPPGLRPPVTVTIDAGKPEREHTLRVDVPQCVDPQVVSFRLSVAGSSPSTAFEGDYRGEVHGSGGRLVCRWGGSVTDHGAVIGVDVKSLYLKPRDSGGFRVWEGWSGRYDMYNADGSPAPARETTFRIPLPPEPCSLTIRAEGFELLEQVVDPSALGPGRIVDLPLVRADSP